MCFQLIVAKHRDQNEHIHIFVALVSPCVCVCVCERELVEGASLPVRRLANKSFRRRIDSPFELAQGAERARRRNIVRTHTRDVTQNQGKGRLVAHEHCPQRPPPNGEVALATFIARVSQSNARAGRVSVSRTPRLERQEPCIKKRAPKIVCEYGIACLSVRVYESARVERKGAQFRAKFPPLTASFARSPKSSSNGLALPLPLVRNNARKANATADRIALDRAPLLSLGRGPFKNARRTHRVYSSTRDCERLLLLRSARRLTRASALLPAHSAASGYMCVM